MFDNINLKHDLIFLHGFLDVFESFVAYSDVFESVGLGNPPSQYVNTELWVLVEVLSTVYDDLRVDHVSEGLGHLLALPVQHETVGVEVFEGGRVVAMDT